MMRRTLLIFKVIIADKLHILSLLISILISVRVGVCVCVCVCFPSVFACRVDA